MTITELMRDNKVIRVFTKSIVALLIIAFGIGWLILAVWWWFQLFIPPWSEDLMVYIGLMLFVTPIAIVATAFIEFAVIGITGAIYTDPWDWTMDD